MQSARQALLRLTDLDEVAAGVVEDGDGRGAHWGRFGFEGDAELFQSLELFLGVLHGKGGVGDTGIEEGFLVTLGRGETPLVPEGARGHWARRRRRRSTT